MKNICFLNSIVFWGGGEKFHLDHAVALDKLEFNVIVACNSNSELKQRALNNNLPVFEVTIGNLAFLNPFIIFKLYRFFRNKNIDTVFMSTSQDVKAGTIAAYMAGVKNIVYARALAAPVKASIINKWVLNKQTLIIANSEETKNCLLKNLRNSIDESKIKTIYYGIPKIDFMAEVNLLPGIQSKAKGVILGNAGRLTKQKGQDKLIELALNLKNQGIAFTLFIAGTGELYDSLKQKIAEHNLSNDVFLLGFVNDIASFMKSIDVFILTSAWEGFGYVLVEAMVQEKPVVAFNITSNPEVVKNNQTGLLANYPDILDFTDKVVKLAKSPHLRESMGKAGREVVKNNFIFEDRLNELIQLLN